MLTVLKCTLHGLPVVRVERPTFRRRTASLGQPVIRFLPAKCLPLCAHAATFVGVASLYALVLSGAALVGHHSNQVNPFGRSLTFGLAVDLVAVGIGDHAIAVEDIRAAVNDGRTRTALHHFMKEPLPRVVKTGAPVHSGRN